MNETKASIIRRRLMEALDTGRAYRYMELKAYVEEREHHQFTPGEFAGALRSLLANPKYRTIQRGVYQLVREENNATNHILEDMNNFVQDVIIKMKERLRQIDITEANTQVLNDIAHANEIIKKIENIKEQI